MKELPTETATCKGCSREFTYAPFEWFNGEIWKADQCEVCDEAQAAESKARKEAEASAQTRRDRAEFWADMCPPRFASSDLNHPEFRAKLHKRVMAWVPTLEKPWLGIVGNKGCCKTRIALLRLEAIIMAKEGPFSRGCTAPIFTTAYEFAETVQARFGSTHDRANERLEEYNSCRWLVFDDIGKARNTPAVVSALFALIDHRHSHNRSTIWTANSTPEEFCEGMPSDVAGPMVRRIKESSTMFSIL